MPEQTFVTTDVLQLQVEDDPTGLVNLAQNPSGELGGWAWVTPVASSTLSGAKSVGGAQVLSYMSVANVANYFYSEPLPISATWYASASWIGEEDGGGHHRARFEWLDSNFNVLSSSAQSADYTESATTRTYGPVQAPASTAYVRIRFDIYSGATGTGNVTNAAARQFRQVTVAKASTSSALATTRTNRMTNPSFETNTNGWQSGYDTIARSTAQASIGTASLAVTASGAYTVSYAGTITPTASVGLSVTPGLPFTFSFRTRAATTARNVYAAVAWYNDATYVSASSSVSALNSTTGWTTFAKTWTAPAGVNKAQVTVVFKDTVTGEVHYIDAALFEQLAVADTYFDGDTTDTGSVTYSWTGTAHGSTSTRVESNLAYIEPVPYLSILGDSQDIKIVREELDVGTLSAVILSDALDPAVSDLLRPGRRVRLQLASSGEPIFLGRASNAKVTYDFLGPTGKKARIELTAEDALAPLANVKRRSGVATIANLPYVLEGAGIPWNVNGSGNQVASASVVSINDDASAVDQVAITRDSEHGYAWVDRKGVLNAWSPGSISTTSQATLTESVYNTDLDVDFDTARCINSVMVKSLKLVGLETVENTFGPYEDAASIATWGRFQSTFTIHGIAEVSPNIFNFADAILTANATPQKRINSLTIPITDTGDLAYALLDLYDLVTVSNTTAAITATGMRIAGIEHNITPEKWLMKLTFVHDGGVAQPTITPPIAQVAPPPVGLASTHTSASTASIANSTFTTVGGWTGVDNGGLYGSGVGTGSLTIANDGTYVISAGVTFASNTTGRRVIAIFKGATEIAREESASAGFWTGAVSALAPLTAGDVLTVRVFQSSGAALALSNTPGHRWELIRIGPK